MNNKQKRKLNLVKQINGIINKYRYTQKEVATMFNCKQPRVSDLRTEKHDRFSTDVLLGYLEILGVSYKYELDHKELKMKVSSTDTHKIVFKKAMLDLGL
nr:XRE family transcriptional regulator [Moritella viscosa]SHO14656.1 Uncharacterized conserved small protein [Moritella viscosa]